MIFGVISLLFSVSATLKVCNYIIAHKKIMSTFLFYNTDKTPSKYHVHQ